MSIVIIGGGPAGLATALALQAKGAQAITVAESGHYDQTRIGESIPPDIRPLMARLGILSAFEEEGHDPSYGSCASWGGDEMGYNDLVANAHGNGWHLDRLRFERFLADHARDRGIRILTGHRFREVEPTKGGFSCLFHVNGDERQLEARQVVDAGGVGALLASRLGARKRIIDQLICICQFVDLPAHHALSQLTMLEAVEYGWWYAARLPDNKAAIAVASDSNIVKSRNLNLRRYFKEHFLATRYLSKALDSARWPDTHGTAHLAASTILEPCCGRNWVAVGDAASCYDPISSQGIYKALDTALYAADYLTGTVRDYDDRVRSQFSDYLRNRRFFYGMERRWEDSVFWSARHAVDVDVPRARRAVGSDAR